MPHRPRVFLALFHMFFAFFFAFRFFVQAATQLSALSRHRAFRQQTGRTATAQQWIFAPSVTLRKPLWYVSLCRWCVLCWDMQSCVFSLFSSMNRPRTGQSVVLHHQAISAAAGRVVRGRAQLRRSGISIFSLSFMPPCVCGRMYLSDVMRQ